MFDIRKRYRWGLTLCFMAWMASMPIACQRRDPGAAAGDSISATSNPASANSQDLMKQFSDAFKNDRWDHAEKLGTTLLISHAADAGFLRQLARVWYELGKQHEAEDLLLEACRAEGFRNSIGFDQAVQALLGSGRFFDVIDLHRNAVAAQPENDAWKRALFDFLVGVERHLEARDIGINLIRARKFDANLLRDLYAWDRRTFENAPLEQMVERNPSDLRPLIGLAKKQLDLADYASSIELLSRIVDQHPDDPVAASYLVDALVLSGDDASVLAMFSRLPEDSWQLPTTMIALAILANRQGQSEVAIEAAIAAVAAEPMRIDAMQLLLTGWISEMSAGNVTAVDGEPVQRLKQRISACQAFHSAWQQYNVQISKADPLKAMVETLLDLGRLWEAEAWSAVALQSLDRADAQREQIEAVRAKVVGRLTRETPWQSSLAFLASPQSSTTNPRELLARLDPAIASPIDPDLAESSQPAAKPLLPILVNEAAAWDLVHFGRTADRLQQPGVMMNQTIGCGGGVLDIDLDGLSDLILQDAGGTPPASDSRPAAAFRNVGRRFVDVTAVSGIVDHGFGQGVTIGDIDADGFDDLLLLNYGVNSLWVNNGDGTFRDCSDWFPNLDSHWSTSGAMLDVNHDGLTDIVVVNYCAGLDPTTVICDADGMEGHRACSPMRFAGDADQVFQTLPSGGLVDQSPNWLGATPPSRGLGIIAGDLLGDGGVSMLIANDMSANQFWSPDSTSQDSTSPHWSEAASEFGLAGDAVGRVQGSMGIATTDVNFDGRQDFYVTNFENEYNTLYISQGGVWSDQSSVQRLDQPTLPLVGFGTQWIDLDLNGEEELMVTNGHVDSFATAEKRSPYFQPPQCFRRNRSGVFETVVPGKDKYFQQPHVGRALFSGDFDNNGLSDVVITHQTEPTALLINQTEADYHWLQIELTAVESERGAVGSRVEVIGQSQRRQTRTLLVGDGFLSSSQRILQFGLGAGGDTVSIRVDWPSGTTQTFDDVEIDRKWHLIENQPAWSFKPTQAP